MINEEKLMEKLAEINVRLQTIQNILVRTNVKQDKVDEMMKILNCDFGGGSSLNAGAYYSSKTGLTR
jgi:hypothetical protein